MHGELEETPFFMPLAAMANLLVAMTSYVTYTLIFYTAQFTIHGHVRT